MAFWDNDPIAGGSAPATAPAPAVAAPAQWWSADPVAATPAPASDDNGLGAALDAAAAKESAAYSANPAAALGNDVAGLVSPVPGMVRGLPFGDRAEAGAATLTNGKTYAQNLQDVRNTAANNPTESAENVGGALATAVLPVGAIGNAASLVGKVGVGALTGGAIGGAYGLSSTPDLTQSAGQDALNAAKGAGAGALVGGAVPLAGAGLGAAASKVGQLFNPQYGDLGPTANSLLYRALNSDGPAVVQQKLDQLGPQANLMDASTGALSLGQGVSANLGLDNAAIADPLAARAAGTNTRLASDVNAAVGPAPPSAQIASDALKAQKVPFSSASEAALTSAPPIDISPVIQSIDAIKAPDGSPLQGAVGRIRQMLTEDAPTTAAPALPSNPTAQQYQEWLAAQNAPATAARVPVTDAQTLDRARQAIDAMINYSPQGVGPLAGADATAQGIVGNLRTQLSGALKTQVPGYEDAMNNLSSLNKQQQAILDGSKSLGGGQAAINPNDFAADYGPAQIGPVQPGMQPPRTPLQAATNTGMRAAIHQSIGTKPSDLSALQVMLQGAGDPASGVGAGFNSTNIGQAFGPQAENTLQNAATREKTFSATDNAIRGNSLTAKRQAMADALTEATENKPLISGHATDVTTHGLVLGPAKAAINAMAAPFQGHVDAPTVYKNLAQALTATGPSRQQMLSDALASGANSVNNKAMGNNVASAAQLAQALLASGAAGRLYSNGRAAQ